MTEVTLKNTTPDGQDITVTYLPERGMNMISYKKGSTEIIDQSTHTLFDERSAGLGALIGPHFHRRRPQILPKLAHIETNGEKDPFSHGIGRYVPWTYKSDATSIKATLKGDDIWKETPLKEIESQDFTMQFEAHLTPNGLEIDYSVVSECDSIIGIHYYYHLPNGTGKIVSKVKDKYIAIDEILNIPDSWGFNRQTHELTYSLDKDTDFTFHPFTDPTEGTVFLDAGDYSLKTHFTSPSEECSFQLWHPQDASFVCIEPVTAQDPRHPNLTVSSIKIHLEILSSRR